MDSSAALSSLDLVKFLGEKRNVVKVKSAPRRFLKLLRLLFCVQALRVDAG